MAKTSKIDTSINFNLIALSDFSFPNIFIILIQVCGFSADIDPNVTIYTDFFSYLIILFSPFVAIFSLPERQKKLNKILPIRRQTRFIAPEIPPIRNCMNNQPIRPIVNTVS